MHRTVTGGIYPDRMAYSAHDVAAALRAEQPDIGIKKLHKLLYFCQGHHLADLHEPLFRETMMAWAMGPVVSPVWWAENDAVPENIAQLDNGALNTVGYVLSRYGKLSGAELEQMTHDQQPWQRALAAEASGGKERIELEWLAEEFTAERERAIDAMGIDRSELKAWLAGAPVRLAAAGPPVPDDLDEIRAMLAAAGG